MVVLRLSTIASMDRFSVLFLVFFSDFVVLGGLGSLQPQKKLAGDPQISSEMALAKNCNKIKEFFIFFCMLRRICFGDHLKQL